MVDWIMYGKIQEQKRNGLNKSQVARNLQINRETVRTYWDMTPAEYSLKLENAKTRTKKADDYKYAEGETVTLTVEPAEISFFAYTENPSFSNKDAYASNSSLVVF